MRPAMLSGMMRTEPNEPESAPHAPSEPIVEAGFLQASLPAEPDGLLVASAARGRVFVRSHDLEEVRVLAEARGPGADQVVFTFDRDGEDVYFETSEERGFFFLVPRPRIQIELWVPRHFCVDVETRGGSIQLEELQGSVTTRSRGGSQKMRRVAGSIEMASNGGSLTAEQIRGDLEVHTSGGSVKMSDVIGELSVRTSGGSIQVEDLEGPIDVRTSGGSVQIGFVDDPEGEITTSGGSVRVGASADARASIDAHTGGGSIAAEHSGLPEKLKGKRVEAELNGGGPTLRIRTGGGQIRIEEL